MRREVKPEGWRYVHGDSEEEWRTQSDNNRSILTGVAQKDGRGGDCGKGEMGTNLHDITNEILSWFGKHGVPFGIGDKCGSREEKEQRRFGYPLFEDC